ncbi:MAG TPA: histidine--tRNA ligase [Candidatus Paceibacterota bacterium]|nr:histidine--tRNA ligase [Candidatus Paceibacterota bacterium]HRZ34513.1 histidine--tRNA ligase [Candidatus Paceibacterota bacterium]
MNNLKTDSYKGVRDFYPEDMFIQDYIYSVWHSVLQSYGYEHYSASVLEPSEIYEGKTSAEIVSEQTYTFKDRGDRRVTLRPEMTPTITRMVAKKQKSLSFPLRWYSIPNVFRYERPQRGRLREHWQLNVDIFGLDGLEAEAELIEIASAIMRNFGLKDGDFIIKINDRKILEEALAGLGLDENKKILVRKLLDRKDKTKDFEEQMIELVGQSFEKILQPNEKIQELTRKLKARGISNVVFEPMLIRGFDYYTGIVFEIFDTNKDNGRSLFGGGRYDNLLTLFGGEKIGTAGFGMGDVTIREALELRNLLPNRLCPAHVAICPTNELAFDYAASLANRLRVAGIDALVNYDGKKIGEQIKRADKKGIPFIICVGDEEIGKNIFKVKYLKSGKEKELPVEQIADFVSKTLSER